MRKRKAKNIVQEKKRFYAISLTKAWRIYFLETIIKKINDSRFKENILFKGLMIDDMIIEDNQFRENIEVVIENISINKFNINHLFKEVLSDTLFELKDIKLIDNKIIRKYKVDICCHEEDIEQVISIIISERKKEFPQVMKIKFMGLYYNDFLISTYTIHDMVAKSFIKTLYEYNLDSLEILNRVYKKVIINEQYLQESIKNCCLLYKIDATENEFKLALEKLKTNESFISSWNKRKLDYLEEVLVLVDGIIELFKEG